MLGGMGAASSMKLRVFYMIRTRTSTDVFNVYILVNEIQIFLHDGRKVLTIELCQLLDGISFNKIQTYLHGGLELLTIELFNR